MKEQQVVYAWSNNDRLELYLRRGNGSRVFLMAHRFNPTLFNYLRNGRTVMELRAFRPGRGRGEKAMHSALRQAVRVVDWLAAEEAEEAEAIGIAG
ncbi:MAG: hypothetical protein IJG53_01075 [Eggerthellaceae bacterium]|nr:hypothetical protein [Eggerthellaceae bacterium]